jgi:hypothetical protein
MNLLFDDKYAPITKEIGFLECDIKSVCAAYQLWETEILRQYKMRIELENVEGNLESVLRNLLPLTTPIRTRLAFVPTQSAWTAYFDNGPRGTDATGVVKVLAEKLNCRGIRTVLVPNTMPSKPSKEARGRYGATMLEVYGPDRKPIRIIYAANDGGRWVFGESGVPFPFEETARYAAKKIRDKFTGEMLDDYLKHLGIAAFDETFYVPSNTGSILARKLGKLPDNLREIPLLKIDGNLILA